MKKSQRVKVFNKLRAPGERFIVCGISIIFTACSLPPSSIASDKEGISIVPVYVGHGSATLISSSCFTALYDAGGRIDRYETLKNALKTTGRPEKKFLADILFISHGHKDHYRYLQYLARDGLEITTLATTLSNIDLVRREYSKDGKIGQVIGFDWKADSEREKVLNESIQRKCMRYPDIEVLWGSTDASDGLSDEYMRKKENNDSLVVGMSGLRLPVLFLGDMNKTGQDYLLRNRQSSLEKYKGGILFVGHHGISNGINKKLLSYLRPSYAVISRDSRFPMIKEDLLAINSFVPQGDATERDVLCGKKPKGLSLKQLVSKLRVCRVQVSKRIKILSPEQDVRFEL